MAVDIFERDEDMCGLRDVYRVYDVGGRQSFSETVRAAAPRTQLACWSDATHTYVSLIDNDKNMMLYVVRRYTEANSSPDTKRVIAIFWHECRHLRLACCAAEHFISAPTCS